MPVLMASYAVIYLGRTADEVGQTDTPLLFADGAAIVTKYLLMDHYVGTYL